MMMMMMVKKKLKLFPLSLLSFFSVQIFLKKPLLATIFGYRLQEKEVTCSDLQLKLKKKKKLKLKLKNSIEKSAEKGRELKGVLALIKYSPRCGDLVFLLFSPSFLLSLSGDRTITHANTHTHPQRGFTKDSGLNWFFSCFVFLFV